MTTEEIDEIIDAIVKVHGDANLGSKLQKVKLDYEAKVKRIQELEMALANDKKELFEDPLAIHALHLTN